MPTRRGFVLKQNKNRNQSKTIRVTENNQEEENHPAHWMGREDRFGWKWQLEGEEEEEGHGDKWREDWQERVCSGNGRHWNPTYDCLRKRGMCRKDPLLMGSSINADKQKYSRHDGQQTKAPPKIASAVKKNS